MWYWIDLSLEVSAGVSGGDGGFRGDVPFVAVLITSPFRAGDEAREEFGVMNPVLCSPIAISCSGGADFLARERFEEFKNEKFIRRDTSRKTQSSVVKRGL